MMNRNKKLLITLSALLFFIGICKAGDVPTKIITGFQNGDAALISQFFRNTVELNIQSKEQVFSSTQAELILKNFFKNNPPSSFSIIHNGGQGESRYAIGTLTSSTGKFRVTLLIKEANNTPYIHQLRIEKDDI